MTLYLYSHVQYFTNIYIFAYLPANFNTYTNIIRLVLLTRYVKSSLVSPDEIAKLNKLGRNNTEGGCYNWAICCPAVISKTETILVVQECFQRKNMRNQ